MGIQKWDRNCHLEFADLKGTLTAAPILVPTHWASPFRCHVDEYQKSVGGTIMQLDLKGCERVIVLYSRKLSDVEQTGTTNAREVLGLVYCLRRYRWYL